MVFCRISVCQNTLRRQKTMRKIVFPYSFSAQLTKFFSAFSKRVRQAFFAYCTGLVMTVRFRSIKRFAEDRFNNRVDALHHFLANSPCREEKILSSIHAQITKAAGRPRKDPLLIIDDTPVERNGSHIEGAGFHHGSKGIVKGQCVVTAVVLLARLVLGLATKGYRPKRTCPRKQFKTKIDLALEVIEEACSTFRQFTVLLDAWYTCWKVLKKISNLGWRYVAAIKSNRIVFVKGRKTSVRNLAKGRRKYYAVRLSRRRRVEVAKCIVTLPKLGEVALFITKTDGHIKYLVSNDLGLTEREAARLYAQRWTIETWHRDMKQHLGFGELFVRSWRACQRHWTLCLIAYNALVLWNASLPVRKRSGTFGSVVRTFRETDRSVYGRPNHNELKIA